MPITASICPLILLFIFFYLGQQFHSSLLGLSDTVYQTEWYRYPRSVRRFLLLMILRAQKPFYLCAYNILALNLENYVGVSYWCKFANAILYVNILIILNSSWWSGFIQHSRYCAAPNNGRMTTGSTGLHTHWCADGSHTGLGRYTNPHEIADSFICFSCSTADYILADDTFFLINLFQKSNK